MSNFLLLQYAFIVLVASLYLVGKLQHDYHMFQQNSYRPERYWRWLRGQHNRFIKGNDNLFVLAMGLMALATTLHPLSLGQWSGFIGLYLLGSLFTLLAYKGHGLLISVRPSKKPLVYTPRVKRMMATMGILLTIDALVLWLLPLWVVPFLYGVGGLISFIIPMVTVWINSPMEGAINRWYYNDAKRILRENPNRIVIGITGSYGKTSTKNLIADVLSRRFNVLATPASYNTLLGVIRTIREQMKPTHDVFIVEMGARQMGDIKEICDLVVPDYGLITSIGPQHLETMGSLDNIIKTKGELFEGVKPGGKAFVNLSDGNIAKLKSRGDIDYIGFGVAGQTAKTVDKHVQDSKTYQVGPGQGQDRNTFDGKTISAFMASHQSISGKGTSFTLTTPAGSQAQLTTKLLGGHNVGNVLSAMAIASSLGIADDKLQKLMVDVKPVAHRLSLRQGPKGQIILDDAFNSNPVGSKNALDVLQAMEGGQKVVITPGMIELGEEQDALNEAFGSHMAGRADFVVLVGAKQTKPIQEGLAKAGFPDRQTLVVSSFIEGWNHINQMTGQGDVILIENDLPDAFNE